MMRRRSGDAGRQGLLRSRTADRRLDRRAFLTVGESAEHQHRAGSARRRNRLVRRGAVRGRRRPLDGNASLERHYGHIRRFADVGTGRLDNVFTYARRPSGRRGRSDLAEDQRQRDHGAAHTACVGPEVHHDQIRMKSTICSRKRQLVTPTVPGRRGAPVRPGIRP